MAVAGEAAVAAAAAIEPHKPFAFVNERLWDTAAQICLDSRR